MEKDKDYLEKQLGKFIGKSSLQSIKNLVASSYKIRSLDPILNNIEDYYPVRRHLPPRLTDEEYEALSEDEKIDYDFTFVSSDLEFVEHLKSRLSVEELYALTGEILGKIDLALVDLFFNDFVGSNKIILSDYAFYQILDGKEPNLLCGMQQLGSSYVQPNAPNYDDYYINLQRLYTYNDVVTLVHEFFHHTNAKMADQLKLDPAKFNINRSFSEAESIYFETFAIDYLIKEKKVSLDDIDCTWRIKRTREKAEDVANYSLLFVYERYKNIDFSSYKKFLYEEYGYTNDEKTLMEEYKGSMLRIENMIYYINFIKGKEAPRVSLSSLVEENILINHSHYLGTLLTFSMRRNTNKEQMLYFNDYIKGSRKNGIMEQANKTLRFMNVLGEDIAIHNMKSFIQEYVPETFYLSSKRENISLREVTGKSMG